MQTFNWCPSNPGLSSRRTFHFKAFGFITANPKKSTSNNTRQRSSVLKQVNFTTSNGCNFIQMSHSDLSVLTTCISIAFHSFQRQRFPLTPTRAGALRHIFALKECKRVKHCSSKPTWLAVLHNYFNSRVAGLV